MAPILCDGSEWSLTCMSCAREEILSSRPALTTRCAHCGSARYLEPLIQYGAGPPTSLSPLVRPRDCAQRHTSADTRVDMELLELLET
jgi:hypothetical protein